MLERRGLKDRDWAVEWEASAQEFLLEKGFSPEMGARPLKRAIDQYVIAPLAATIVERAFPRATSSCSCAATGGRSRPSSSIPTENLAGDPHLPVPERQRNRRSAGDDTRAERIGTELDALHGEHAELARTLTSAQWEDLKSAPRGCAWRLPSFWTRTDRHETLARLALMDRVQAAAATADSLGARLAKGTERTGKYSRELVGRLALQLHLIKEGIRDVLESAPIEVALMVEPAFEKPSENETTRRWCAQVLGCIAHGPTTGTCS